MFGRRASLLPAVLAAGVALVACTSSVPESSATETGTPSPTPSESDDPTAEPTPTEPPDYPNPWGPTPADVEAATRVAAEMTPEEVAGQVIVSTTTVPDPAAVGAHVADLHLAGVIVMGDAVTGLDQVLALTESVQDGVAADGRDWPAIISTDNEGGIVQRLGSDVGPWTDFPAYNVAGQAVAAGEHDVVHDAYEAMGVELRASGFTTDWAPVADVTVPGQDVTIGTRSAGSDPGLVSATVSQTTTGFLDSGVLPSAKHFPGHGSLTSDSHVDLPVQDRSDAEIAAQDLPPFQAAIAAGTPTVMVGHIDVQAWDPGVAASVSPETYRVLREDLGFSGVAVTDGLEMGALSSVGGPGDIAVAALDAGADLLLGPTDDAAAHAGIVAALEDGRLSRDRVDEAAGRVIAMARYQAELAERAGPVGPDDVGSAAQPVADLWDAAG
ncbi:glycoside hydrolase family 3 N-terminal domain-containing protein [Georgenia alba]|uniref:beta-N-acetylhexosaminidase n=1 Tax=Georgenia alba TaxID=2233858 RepID=A0ABW2Q9H3_9MICO